MARKKRDEIHERDIGGLKILDKLAPLLERLHDDSCLRDKAGNRTLHYDQYCLLALAGRRRSLPASRRSPAAHRAIDRMKHLSRTTFSLASRYDRRGLTTLSAHQRDRTRMALPKSQTMTSARNGRTHA